MPKLRYTALFKRDFRRGVSRGCDPEKLRSLLELLRLGAPLPLSSRDGPLKNADARACRVEPGWLLVYREKKGVVTLMRVKYIRKERPTGAPPMKLWFRTLLRSPVKTALTVLLLAVAAYFFAGNLAGYVSQQKTVRQVEDSTFGVLTAEKSMPKKMADPTLGIFILTDRTNPGSTIGDVVYENCHHQALSAEEVSALEALPYVDAVDKRYMTAGLSDDYFRMDDYRKYYGYADRCILEGTVVSNELDRFWTAFHGLDAASESSFSASQYEAEGFRDIILTDVKLLSGNRELFELYTGAKGGKVTVLAAALRKEFIGTRGLHLVPGGQERSPVNCTDYDVSLEDVLSLVPGRRYVFVLRENPYYTDPDDEAHFLYSVGDDSRKGWWPYFTDITGLSEDYLETEDYAELRSLIEVSDADRHTFDVVYTDDMASIRRVTQEQMTPVQGRFLGPADAGQPVCVVSEAFLERFGLRLGDTVTLRLGNYLMEQYAPLGAVAVTRGRYATAWTEKQSFTVVGSFADVGDGAWLDRELYWAYSSNAVFVPVSFLPASCDTSEHALRPAEVSFLVRETANILPFETEVLPQVEEMQLQYEFADRNWAAVAEKMAQAQASSLMRLLAFALAAALASVLTVYLFLIRRKREYAVLRALGSSKSAAARALWLPLLALSVFPVLIGALLARFRADAVLRAQAEAGGFGSGRVPQMAPAGYLLCVLGILCLLLVLCLVYLRRIGRKSPWLLLQEKEK